ncbi:ornithine carbamoyltransferase [Hippea maritima]|uniref:Ornithine carbamoyltransferase n=1 Tax=Hippea maritima (strain ATCC 700847 / DSM 10411 / MH2) TaxID=760142 RepID=F2LX43_HIPMA|nr:ornithine carbamoyltransferase [Hippea maritima]AEA33101.1 Ornithine carbamoyltransferase [Hippea maritima DSM 10411]
MIRHCLSLKDLTKQEILELLDLSQQIKNKIKSKQDYKPLSGVILGMIFEKPSTRTRLSFEAGMKRLGGDAIFLSPRDIQLGRGETIEDTARVISRYVDIVMIRTFEHSRIERFAQYSTVPVINALTDLLHPCQVLADLLTIKEKLGRIEDIKVAFFGDGNNMANSWIYAAAVLGFELRVATPVDFAPNGVVVKEALELATKSGARIILTNNPEEAAKDADVLYTDVWASMGQEDQKEKKHALMRPYQVNRELVKYANKDYIFMHCLPAHRGEEVEAEVIDDEKHSVIFDEAENRTYAQLATIMNLIGRV